MGGLYLGGKLVSPVVVIEKPIATDEWQPNPNWWDIKSILDADTREYAGKVGVILYNFNDVSNFTLSSSGMTAVATSDGAFYTYADNGANITHNWDTAQDKDDGRGFKTRWVIYYYTTDTTGDSFTYASEKFGWTYNCIAYLVLKINCSGGSAFCRNHTRLEGVYNVGYPIKSSSFSHFCGNCVSLRKVPDEIDTSICTDINNFCSFCTSLMKISYVLDTSRCDTFQGFLYNCRSLQSIPNVLDVSNSTNFYLAFYGCENLTSLPDTFDTSNGTRFSSFLNGMTTLIKVPEITLANNTTDYTSAGACPLSGSSFLEEVYLTLPSNTNFWLNASTRISIESFRYIADHAPDVTATPRTLTIGSTNISRINAADPTIITDLNARGWTVA